MTMTWEYENRLASVGVSNLGWLTLNYARFDKRNYHLFLSGVKKHVGAPPPTKTGSVIDPEMLITNAGTREYKIYMEK